MRFSALLAFGALFATGAFAENPAEQNDGRVELGYLNCTMTDTGGGVLISETSFDCTFEPNERDINERYALEITSYGLDLKITDGQDLRWAVLAPASFDRQGVLEGDYAGLSADIAAGYSLGAKALVGGGDESIALQPLSVTTGEGLGAALGVDRATLTYRGIAS